jgi:hypothetical protein
MLVQITRFKSALSKEEVFKAAEERKPSFLDVPGLVQKYYVVLKEPDSYGGIYVFEDADALAAYQRSDLAATIPEAYKVVGQPQVEILDVFMPLRD